MNAILKKTLGPNFKAGDIIKGENSRIKVLYKKGLVVLDHSLIAMIGNIITFIFTSLLLWLVIFSFIDGMYKYIPVNFSLIWQLTILVLGVITILINISYFLNARIPYTAYFLAFVTNIFGGILIMIGHERHVSKYNSSNVSASAAFVLFSLGSLIVSIFLLTTINYNTEVLFNSSVLKNSISWLLFVFLIATGVIISSFYDYFFNSARSRYISFLKRKNVTIEYKTKALNAYRAYLNSGNAEEFLEKNIDIMEKTLEVDRSHIDLKKK